MSQLFGNLSTSLESFGTGIRNTPYTTPIIAAIFGIFIIVLIIYGILQLAAKYPATTLLGPVDIFKPQKALLIDRSTSKKTMGGTYTFSFFMRVDAVPDMRSDATPFITWPGMWAIHYNPAFEEIVWYVQPPIKYASDANADTINVVPVPERISLRGVPLQKWTQITLGFEGRTMDLYVNGILKKSHSLVNLPPAMSSSISLVPGGIMGQVAYIQLWSRRLPVSEVGANYVATSDSVGRPYLGPEFINALKNIQLPNLFCSGEGCGTEAKASPNQNWEFPYA